MFKKQPSVIYAALVFISLILGVTAAHASEIREIELVDGTVIAGEIVSLSNDIYTISSVSLGTIRINASSVRTIRTKGAQGSAGASEEQVKSLQEKMMGDHEIVDIIQALQNDKDLQEVLADPEIMKAVKSGDLSALMANPRFLKLLNKQAIQQIKDKLSH